MRTHVAVTSILSVFLFTAAGHAQTDPEADRITPKVHGGVSLLAAAPVGAFGDQIDQAFGAGAHVLLRVHPAGLVALRMDASWLNHGRESDEVALASPLGGTRNVDLTTTNSLATLGLGPELSISVAGVRPYVGASGGIAYFLTNVYANDSDGPVSFSTNVQHQDVVFAYGAHAGLRFPLGSPDRSLAIDVGARYQRGGEAEFLPEGNVTVDESGVIALDPARARLDAWIFHAGVSIPLAGARRIASDDQ